MTRISLKINWIVLSVWWFWLKVLEKMIILRGYESNAVSFFGNDQNDDELLSNGTIHQRNESYCTSESHTVVKLWLAPEASPLGTSWVWFDSQKDLLFGRSDSTTNLSITIMIVMSSVTGFLFLVYLLTFIFDCCYLHRMEDMRAWLK